MKTTILINGKIYVNKDKFCSSLAFHNGIIKAIGSEDEVLNYCNSPTEIIDCEGKTIIPGFNDSHQHLMQYAESLNQAKISDARSPEHLASICSEFIKANPDKSKQGLHSIGWNQDNFLGAKTFPCKDILDSISTDIPILLERVCGHIALANSFVLKAMGIDPVHHDGLLRAEEVVSAKALIPDFTYTQRKEFLVDAMNIAASYGITSVQSNDVGSGSTNSDEMFNLLRDIYETNKAPIRYRHQMYFDTLEQFAEYATKGEFKNRWYDENKMLSLGPLKLFKDGSLGAKTAFMLNPYKNDQYNYGREWLNSNSMDEFCHIATENGIQVITHAIGDRAIKETIDCYEKNIGSNGNKLRHGIVHCQITDISILQRINALDILVFAQPIFIDYDMHIVSNLCDKKLISTSYAFGTLLREGVHLSYGTDVPVESFNPFDNIYAAVTRKDKSGYPNEGFFPCERVDVQSAIDAYTYESAYAEFQEKKKGRLMPGYYADMTILNKDIFTAEEDEIRDIRPTMTIINGKIFQG